VPLGSIPPPPPPFHHKGYVRSQSSANHRGVPLKGASQYVSRTDTFWILDPPPSPTENASSPRRSTNHSGVPFQSCSKGTSRLLSLAKVSLDSPPPNPTPRFFPSHREDQADLAQQIIEAGLLCLGSLLQVSQLRLSRVQGLGGRPLTLLCFSKLLLELLQEAGSPCLRIQIAANQPCVCSAMQATLHSSVDTLILFSFKLYVFVLGVHIVSSPHSPVRATTQILVCDGK